MNFLEINTIKEEIEEMMPIRFGQIYQIDDTFLVKLKKGYYIRIILPNLIYLSHKRENIDRSGNFALFLRRRIKGAYVKEVKQLRSERIVYFKLVSKGKVFFLFVELFSKGNIILTNEDKEIIGAYHSKIGSSSFEKGETYNLDNPYDNLFELSEKDFNEKFEDVDLFEVIKGGFGKVLAHEISLNEDKSRYENWKELLSRERKGIQYFEEGEDEDIKDISPIELNYYSNLKKKEFDTFSAALDDLTKRFYEVENKEKKALKKSLRDQKGRIDEINDGVKLNKKKAEFLYHNYQEIEEILKMMRKKFEKEGVDGLKNFLKENNIPFKNINSKEKSVVLEFDD